MSLDSKLKKNFNTLAVISLMVTGLFAFSFDAVASNRLDANFVVDQQQYTVNGTVQQMDAKSFIENGRTYVPVRYLGYSLGLSDKEVHYDEAARAAILTKENRQVIVKIGSNILNYTDKVINMDVAPILRSGRIYLPARWVAEAFGYQVNWDKAGRVVTITNGDAVVTPVVVEPPVVTPEGTQNIGGFTVPKNPTVTLNLPSDTVNIGFSILITASNYSEQLRETEKILSSKYDSKTVSEIMTYVKQKKSIDDVLENKKWNVGGDSVWVSGNWNSPRVSINSLK